MHRLLEVGEATTRAWRRRGRAGSSGARPARRRPHAERWRLTVATLSAKIMHSATKSRHHGSPVSIKARCVYYPPCKGDDGVVGTPAGSRPGPDAGGAGPGDEPTVPTVRQSCVLVSRSSSPRPRLLHRVGSRLVATTEIQPVALGLIPSREVGGVLLYVGSYMEGDRG